MAGQPPEPSFQPANQEQGLTQGRPAWQPGAYPPPAGNGGQPGYSAPNYGSQDQAYAAPPPPPGQGGYPPQDPGYAAQDQGGYGAQNQGYPPQDQTYVAGAPGASQDYQGYQGYQPPGYGAQGGPDQGAGAAGSAQWQQGLAGMKPAAPRKQHGEKGFIGSLLDFSFTSLVTPKIIKVLYGLLTAWTVLVGLFFLVIGFRTGGIAGGLFTLIIVEPIFILLTLGIWRVVLEAFMVVFRVYEETKKIAENTGTRD